MGILRVWLALAVLTGHLGDSFGLPFLNPKLAVEGFFAVSGFYMGLVLETKYQRRSGIFFINRLLRIYPAYLAVLFLSVGFSIALWYGLHLAGGPFRFWLEIGPRLSPGSRAFLALSQIFMLGQSITMFSDVRAGAIHFSTHPYSHPLPALAFLFLPQAWSLAAEDLYYLAAPLLARLSTRWIFALTILGIAVKWALLQRLGFDYDPWNYQFFPAEFCFFLAGLLSWRLYRDAKSRGDLNPLRIRLGSLLFWIVLFLTPLFQDSSPLAWVLVGSVFILGMPSLFEASRLWQWDRNLGGLSYPLYLCHILVAVAMNSPVGVLKNSPFFDLLCVGMSLLLAWILYRSIDHPLERIRRRLSQGG